MPSPLADAEWVFLRDADDFSLGIARLVDALETDLAWRDQHTRLAGRAREWLDSDRDSSYLLRGSDLREAEAWLTQQEGHREAPTREQGEYVARSRQVASRRLYSLVGGLTVALVIAIGLSVFALIQRSTAVRRATIATSRQLAASAEADLGPEPEQSIALAARGVRVRQTPEAIHALSHALVTSRLRAEFRGPTPVQSLAFAPNGSAISVGGEDGAVRLWRVTDHRLLWSAGSGELPATSLAFAPSGDVLLVGRSSVSSARGCLVEVLSAATGARERMLGSAGTGNCVRFVGFLGTTGFAAVGAQDGTLELWDVQRRHLLQTAHLLDPADLPAPAMAVSADGRALAIAGLHKVVEVNTRNGKLTTIRSSPSGIFNPNGMAFSPDDNAMVISGEFDAELYNLSQHAGVDLYAQATGSHAPTWSSDGRLVAAAVGFTGIDVWRPSSTRLVEQLHGGSAAGFTALAFARNGLLAGGSSDGSVRVWAPDPDLPDRVVPASSIAAYAVPGAHLAVVGDAQNGLGVFDDVGKLVKSISLGGDGPIALASAGQVAFTSHGRLDVLQLPSETLIRSWALQSGSAPSGVAISGDGRTAATIAANGTVTLFSTTRPPATFFPHDETPTATITLSPDGRFLTVDTSRGLEIFNTSHRGLVRTEPALTPVFSASGSAVFSASGRFLAIQRRDLSIAIISTTNWRTRAVIEGEPVQAALGFSPDDRLLAGTGGDALLRVWDTTDGASLTSKQVIESSFAATQTGLSRPVLTAAGFALIAVGSEGSVFAYRICDGCLDAAALLRQADVRLRAITPISAP
jgi:WD40 repeat protein